MAFQARTKGGGGFTAKISKRGAAVSKARAANRTRLTRPFAPSRATPASVKEAFKSEDPGPNLMDLLCLHFKDLGYKAKISSDHAVSGKAATLQLQINISDKQPFGSFHGEVILGFHLHNNMIWYTSPGWPGYNGRSPYSMGTPEDPELIGRMEGAVKIFISGAQALSRLVKTALG